MATREKPGRTKPYQVYWNNPFTGKRETASFATKEEALKENSLVKRRLKFDRESFRPPVAEADIQEEKPQELTLEQVYFLYLKEKQFSKKSLLWQLDAMRVPGQSHESMLLERPRSLHSGSRHPTRQACV